MKKVYYSLVSLVLLFIIQFFSVSTVLASSTNPGTEEDYIRQIQELQNVIDNLQDRVETAESANTPEPVSGNPSIIVQEPTTINLSAGSSTYVDVVIKNVSLDTADMVTTKIGEVSNAGIIATFDTGADVRRIMTANATAKIKMKVTASEDTKAGVYTINLEHSYLNNLKTKLTSSSTIKVSIKNDKEKENTNLILTNMSLSEKDLVPGKSFILHTDLINESKNDAKDVQITIDNLNSDGIYLGNSTNIFDYATVQAGSTKNISINLISSNKIKSGTHTITLKLKYTDTKNESVEKSYNYYINVIKSDPGTDKAEVIIESITSPSSSIGVNTDFGMTLTIRNTSLVESRNIKISAAPDGEGAIVPKSTSIQQIKTLGAGQAKEIPFSFAPTTLAKTQNYVIGFTLEYETGETNESEENGETRETLSYTQYQGVNVYNPKADEEEKDPDKEEKISVPKIIISDYHSNPTIVEAGKNFDLSLTFMNTNSEKTIKNIKAYLTVDDGTEKKGNVFSPVQASNTFYIDSISPKATVSRNIQLFTVPDANPRTYNINVNFEYEDMENNEYKSTEIVGINVKQKTELKTSEVTADATEVGMPMYVNFQFYNTGKVPLSNLLVTLEGEGFDFNGNKETYFGNLASGSSDYYDVEIIPTEPGNRTCKILITYEDDAGTEQVAERNFEVNVMEMMDFSGEMNVIFDEKGNAIDPITGEKMEIDPETGEFVPAKNSGGIIGKILSLGIIGVVLLIIIALAFIGLIAFFAIKIIKKKKAEKEGQDVE